MSKYYLDRTRMDLEDDDRLDLGEPDIIPKAKPLRWRTGPVPETDKWGEFLVCSPLSATGYGYSIRKGNLIDAGEKYIPLSDILGLVEG